MARAPSFLSLAFDSYALGMDASTVIGLRMMRMAAGGTAGAAEMRRMVQEKMDSAADLGALAMTGRLGATVESATSKTIKHYRSKVSANRRRLIGKSR